jgi:hypothetical protein
MKMRVMGLMMLMVLSGSFGFAKIADAQEAVLKLGRQMANVREMLEAYVMIGAQIEYQTPKNRLEKLMGEYEAVIEDMEKSFPDPEIKASVAKSKEAWKPVKNALQSAFERADRAKMRKEALVVHGKIRSVIKEIANMKRWVFANKKIADGKELDAAIEIGASTQRLSSHYMMRMWGLPDPTIMEHWNKGVQKYEKGINDLKGSKYGKDPKFKKLLRKVRQQLKYFKTIIAFEDNHMPITVHRRAKDGLEESVEMIKIILKDSQAK